MRNALFRLAKRSSCFCGLCASFGRGSETDLDPPRQRISCLRGSRSAEAMEAFWTLLRDAGGGNAPQDEGLEAPRLRSLRQATGRLSRPTRGGSERSPSALRSKPQKVARKRS